MMAVSILSKIEEDITSSAEVEARKRIEEAERYTNETLEKAKHEAEREAQGIWAKAREEGEMIKKRRVSEAKRKANIEILKAKNEIIDQAYAEVLKRLQGLLESDLYTSRLRSMIEENLATMGSAELKLKLNKRDLERASQLTNGLKTPAGIHLKIDPNLLPNLGGFILTDKDEKIKVDNTLESRLNTIKLTMRKEIAKTLFG